MGHKRSTSQTVGFDHVDYAAGREKNEDRDGPILKGGTLSTQAREPMTETVEQKPSTRWVDVPEPIRPRSAADLLRKETRDDNCETHGPFTSERFLNIWSRCPTCANEQARKFEQERLEYEAKRAEQRLQQRLAGANIRPALPVRP